MLLKIDSSAALNMMKNTGEPQEIAFYCNLLERRPARAETMSTTRRLKGALATPELTAVATVGGCEMLTVYAAVRVMQLCFNTSFLPLFTFLLTANGATSVLCWCV